jgi:translation initiation factor 2B subunit (eIF-2B alpha/beta/delta family)
MTLAQSPELIDWLIQQSPVIVVMGVVIYWLAKRLTKAENDKDELAKDVIKLTTLWEEKNDKIEERNHKLNEKNEKVNEQILELLREIKLIVSSN